MQANEALHNNNLRFSERYFDEETARHYNYFRDFDPTIGRYIESDPIGLEGGANIYSYVEGAPLSFVDVDGLARYSLGEMKGMVRRNNNSALSDELILCLIWNESNFDPFRSSGSGPEGLMMVSPIAVREINRVNKTGVKHADAVVDPERNIGIGTEYLRIRIKQERGVEPGLKGYGTGKRYPAGKIMACERCLKKQTCAPGSQDCLDSIHK
jgi:RHS repeat-associated protein